MTLRVGPIRRLSSVFSRSRVEGHSAASGATVGVRKPRDAEREPRVVADEPRAPMDEPRETICAPKLTPRRCLNEAGHKALR